MHARRRNGRTCAGPGLRHLAFSLAPNLLFGASMPVVICVLNKAKPNTRRGKVLFIDSARQGYFRQGKAQNFLESEHIVKIVEGYEGFGDVDRVAHVADLEELRANDCNPTISPTWIPRRVRVD